MVERHVLSEDLAVGDAVPIGRPFMNLVFEILGSQGPDNVLPGKSFLSDMDAVWGWMNVNPPPEVWRGLRLFPLYDRGRWSLLVAEYNGAGSDMSVPNHILSTIPTDLMSPGM